MKLSAMLLCDFYKIAHRRQYPEGTETVYSTWTPRTSRMTGVNEVVFFGLQAFIKKYLINYFNVNFFERSVEAVTDEYRRYIKHTLGDQDPEIAHIVQLHKLGYLPLCFEALPEGSLVPVHVPMFVVYNTDPRFYWLTNYVETLMSAELWQPSTAATIASLYRRQLLKSAWETNSAGVGFVDFQGHDFSMRGLEGLDAAAASGAGHLLSFTGTDTIPAIFFLEKYYNANIEKELVGTSIPATEHSVMCAHGRDELKTYEHLITNVYPKGFVSIVSDTWDLWAVLENVIKPLKDVICKRDGKVVIRPDSGDPVKIVCGDPDGATEAEKKGVIEVLWDIFGGTVSAEGYRLLDSHIGCIYGDAILLQRCEAICEGLKAKKFASTNMVYGIGSYTYQYQTRDVFGFAFKATLVVVNGVERHIFKDPKTDSGMKKSQRGAIAVVRKGGKFTLMEGLTLHSEVEGDELKVIYLDGKLVKDWTLQEVRENLARSTPDIRVQLK